VPALTRRVRRRIFLPAILLLAVQPSLADVGRIEGRVVDVPDGDTITVLDARKLEHRVRLLGVDAPERGQAGGHRSKESLARLVYERDVRVEWRNRDAQGRIVGTVWVASPDSPCRQAPGCPKTLDAGLAQITMGRAWWFRESAPEQSPGDRGRYESAEQEARARKIGLWRDPKPVPPWEWRRR